MIADWTSLSIERTQRENTWQTVGENDSWTLEGVFFRAVARHYRRTCTVHAWWWCYNRRWMTSWETIFLLITLPLCATGFRGVDFSKNHGKRFAESEINRRCSLENFLIPLSVLRVSLSLSVFLRVARPRSINWWQKRRNGERIWRDLFENF